MESLISKEDSYIIITKSSAGSGKTFNLALRFIQTLININSNKLNPSNLKNILAITFTNKATFEMRQRIIEWMKGIYLDRSIGQEPIINIIKKPLDLWFLDKNHNSGRINKKFLTESLQNSDIKKIISGTIDYMFKYFNDLKVLTIDSFNTFILRALSFSLNLAPDFEIVLNTDSYIDLALNELYEDVVDNEEIKNMFFNYIDYLYKTNKTNLKWDISENIKDNIKFIWNKEKETGLKISELNTVNKFEFDYELFEKFNNALKTLQGNIKFRKRFLTGIETVIDKKDYMAIKNYINKDFVEGELLNKDSDPVPESIRIQYEHIKKEISKHIEESTQFKFKSVIDIYTAFEKELQKITNSNKTVLINQISSHLKNILNDKGNDILPELYYYLSERYNHYLIDEFQDTSTIQWENVEYLIEDSFSTGGTLFLVGDEKQSIYRWRGGNYELVNEIEENFKNQTRGYAAVQSLYKLILSKNFRSYEYVVDFVNKNFTRENIEFFLKKSVGDDNIDRTLLKKYASVYEDVRQEIRDDFRNKGYVRIEIVNALTEDGKSGKKEDVLEILREKFKQTLRDIFIKYKYDYKDVAILGRKNEELETAIKWILELKKESKEDIIKNINIESSETISIKKQPVIIELINLLKFFNNPADNLSFLNFINGSIFSKISNIEFDKLNKWYSSILIKKSHKKVFLYKEFQKWNPELWTDFFAEFFKTVSYMPLYEFIHLIINKWNLFSLFKEEVPYFLRLLEFISELTGAGVNSINGFMEAWDEKEDKELVIRTPENLNAVKLMTIHTSKGLEFPIVIMPFLDSAGMNTNNFFEIDKQNERLNMYYIKKDYIKFSSRLKHIYYEELLRGHIDEINSLYVGFTRARKAVFAFFLDYPRTSKYKELFFKNQDKTLIEVGKFEINEKQGINLADEKIKYLSFADVGDVSLDWLELLKLKVKSPVEINKQRHYAAYIGETVHYLLSLIKRYPDKDLDSKIDITAQKFGIEKKELNNIIEKFFNNKNFKKFFEVDDSVEIFNEFEIADKSGALKRVDRLMLFEDKIYIIDFKTGEEYSAKHSKQINEYKQIISELYPSKNISCFLLYIDEDAVKEV